MVTRTVRHLTQHQADGARSAPRVSGRDFGRMFLGKGMCQAPQLMRIVGRQDVSLDARIMKRSKPMKRK
jgi:hypothetical protein